MLSNVAKVRSRDTVTVIRSVADALALEEDWRSLEARTPEATSFQGFDWCRAWLEGSEAAGAPETLRLVALHREGRLVLLWPLAVRRVWGFRVAHWLAEPLTQYGDVLVEASPERAQWLDLAWREISSWRDVDALELRRVRADAAVNALPALAGRAGDVPTDAAPYIDFGRPDASPSGARSGRTRSALRRRVKQLEALGPVSFEVVAGPREQEEAVRLALDFKRQWLAEKGLASSGLSHPAAGRCLIGLARRAQLLVFRLGVGPMTAALEVGLVRNGRYFSFMQSYAPAFAASGPGRLLFWQLIERCPSLGITTFDFLAPAYEHKREWASDEMPMRDHTLPISAGGVAVVSYLSRIKPALKEIYGRLPVAARRPLAALAMTMD